MSNLSFVVIYAKTKVSPLARAVDNERQFATKAAALGFCIQIQDSGGEVEEIIQLIGDAEDAVLEGLQLALEIDRQRGLAA